MLNRYGLIDIDKILREQDEPPPEGGGPPPAGGEQPAPPPEEDPDEKIKVSKDKAKEEDLVEFRRQHADAIYRLVQAYRNYRKSDTGGNAYPDTSADSRYSFDTQIRSLKSKYEDAGIDAPFIIVFNEGATGLEGDIHLRFLTAIHGGRAGGRGRFMFQSPGAAAEFVEAAEALRDDLDFEAEKGDPRIVSYKAHVEEPEEEPAQAPAAQQPPVAAPAPPPSPPMPGV